MDPTVSAATVHAIAAYAAGLNLPMRFPAEQPRYAFGEVVELWSQAASEARDPFIGRRVAALVPFGAFGVVEHLMLLSGTLHDALRRLIRYYPLVNQAFTLELRTERDAVFLEIVSHDERPILPVYADFVLTSIASRIDLAIGKPGNVQRLGPSTPAFRIDRSLAAARLPSADEDLCAVLESVGSRRLDVTKEMTGRVTEAVGMRPGQAGLAAIARHIGVSERTLQRRLVEEGTTFREVLNATRRRMAVRLLRERHDTKEVGDHLGFAEVSSFHRAFRRWTGTTPRRFR